MSPWTRFSLAAGQSDPHAPDAVRYGPGLPPESELKLLGRVEGRRVLDLGCGAGSGAVSLAKAGAKVIAVDPDPANLAATRRLAEREGVKVEARQGTPAELAFVRADTIDLAVSAYGLAAVDDLDRVFRQVHRVLRTDRPLVFSLPHPAFCLLDPASEAPFLRRTWWDRSPVSWSVAPSMPVEAADRPRTLAGLFGGLGRANFRVDAMLEPRADPTLAGAGWADAMRWVPPTLIIRARKLGN